MRKLTIIRKYLKPNDSFFVMIDGNIGGKLSAENYEATIDENAHEICTYNNGAQGEIFKIPKGDKSFVLAAKPSGDGETFDLFSTSKSAALAPARAVGQPEERSITISVISAIIIGLVMTGIALFLFLINQTSVVGLLACIIFSVAGSACMIVGGHWIIIIPLPYIFVWKTGCVRKNHSTTRKVLTAIFSIVLPLLGFLLLFILRNIVI